MLAASGSFAALVTDVEYYGAWLITIGTYPDMTLALQSLSIDAQTVSDLPDGTRLQAGYPSMAAEFTLSGLVDPTDETKTAAWFFGRYSTTSPIYQQDALYSQVTIDLGLYTATAGGSPEYVRKFTGVIDEYTCNEDGSVSFTCIDKVRALLRSVPSLPAVVTAPPFNAGLTSEFAADRLLRAATNSAISSWPAIRSSCVLAVGLHSSLWPEVGTLYTGNTQPNGVYTQGVYGTGLAPPSVALGGLTNVTYTVSPLGTSVFIEYFVKGTFLPSSIWISDSASSLSGFPQFIVQVKSTGLDVIPFGDGGGTQFNWATSVSTAAHYVAFKVTLPAVGSAAWSATAYLDGASSSSGAMTKTNVRGATAWDTITVVPQQGTIEGLQVTTESSPSLNNGFVPGAIFTPSLNSLDVIPEIASGDPFQEIQQIAGAELAVAGGDESGTFRFYNRSTIRGMSSVRAITSATSLTGVGGVQTSAASVVNHATAEYTGYNFASTRTTAWSLSKARRVPKGGTLTLKATTDNLFANVDTTATNLAGGSSDVANSHYRASVDKAGTAEFGGTLTFTVTQTGSQQLQIVVSNPTGQDAWLVSPANYVDIPVGTPLLRIAALAVTAADTLTTEYQYNSTPGYSARFGDQALQISGNPWVQDDTTAATLVQDVVQDMYLPKPNLTGVSIVPDPRIQLIDVVHLQDPDRTFVDEYARVFGWHIEWSSSEGATNYDMTLDARTVALPGGWIGGVAGRSEGGLTTYGY